MTVDVHLTRDEAEALLDAAIYKMQREPMRSHLWEAAVDLRIACGMHACSERPLWDAMEAVEKQLCKEKSEMIERIVVKKECPRCGKKLHPLGYARHMAMHRDADELLDKYKRSKDGN